MDNIVGQMRGRALTNFKRWKEYRDDLPEERLKPGETDYDRYKCRINFISGMSLTINRLIHLGILSQNDTILERWYEYVEMRIQTRQYSGVTVETDRTTPDGIIIINTTIEHVIGLLEGSSIPHA